MTPRKTLYIIAYEHFSEHTSPSDFARIDRSLTTFSDLVAIITKEMNVTCFFDDGLTHQNKTSSQNLLEGLAAIPREQAKGEYAGLASRHLRPSEFKLMYTLADARREGIDINFCPTEVSYFNNNYLLLAAYAGLSPKEAKAMLKEMRRTGKLRMPEMELFAIPHLAQAVLDIRDGHILRNFRRYSSGQNILGIGLAHKLEKLKREPGVDCYPVAIGDYDISGKSVICKNINVVCGTLPLSLQGQVKLYLTSSGIEDRISYVSSRPKD